MADMVGSGATSDGSIDEAKIRGGRAAVAVFAAVLVAAAIVALLVSPGEPNAQFASSAAVLTFVGALAVGIERITEGFWSLIDRAKRFGGWWPLRPVLAAIKRYEDNVKDLFDGPLQQLTAVLNEVRATAEAAGDPLDEIDSALAQIPKIRSQLQAKVNNARKLAPGSARVEIISAATESAIDDATKLLDALKLPQQTAAARETLQDVRSNCQQAVDIIAAFNDNPARRLASFIAGASVGMLIAAFLGLNIFLATLQSPPTDTDTPPAPPAAADDCALDNLWACTYGKAGVVATGILLGLGANPTHEVIKALQRRRRDGDDPVAYTASPNRDATSAAQGGTDADSTTRVLMLFGPSADGGGDATVPVAVTAPAAMIVADPVAAGRAVRIRRTG